MLFRPGGHGALLKNLNSFDEKADIVFIKNIDNVVPEARRSPVLKSTMNITCEEFIKNKCIYGEKYFDTIMDIAFKEYCENWSDDKGE